MERQALLDELAGEILHNYARGRRLVAVDGASGAGKTEFANELAAAIRARGHPAARASIDGFHNPREVRYARGRESAEGYYRDAYDYAAFRRILVEPFRSGRDFRTAAFDHVADAPVDAPAESAPEDAILVVDGTFLNRPELRGLWAYSIWLDAPFDVRRERMVARDGDHPPLEHPIAQRYESAQLLYRHEVDPRTAADAIVDNADLEHPVRRFSDWCVVPR